MSSSAKFSGLSENVSPNSAFRHASRTRAPSPGTYEAPESVFNLSSELQELRSLAEVTKSRVRRLEALLIEPALCQVVETQRLMRDAHRNLESLQGETPGGGRSDLVEEVVVEAWQVCQRLSGLEAKLRRALAASPTTEARGAATWETQSPVLAERSKSRSHNSSARLPIPLDPIRVIETHHDLVEEQSAHELALLYKWPTAQDWAEDRRYLSAISLPRGPIPASPTMTELESQTSARYNVEGDIERACAGSPSDSAGRRSSIDDLTALPAFPGPPTGLYIEAKSSRSETIRFKDSDRGLRAAYFQHEVEALPGRCASARKRVETTCFREESLTTISLRDPDRQREGSVTGPATTHEILAGIDDRSHCLPRLQFIKIHELKRLKEWLVQNAQLSSLGEISTTEKVLHLVLVLQEGWRMETLAVVFSRTPRQVLNSCRDAFNRMLEMHSETSLERDQPTCSYIWKIAQKFTDDGESEKWERYYHWRKQDVFKVLVSLNLYIGRYRQQGQVALSGPYQHWWRHFAPPNPAQ